jgi:hypothetical protein
MSNLQQRNYYKIFTGTNQTGGNDKIHLGYEASTNEIIFPKDQTTYFHMPFFASTQLLSDSTLVGDGAVAGTIPALSDRIFKKQGGYGNTTPWGNSTIQDGTWFCSWLYAATDSDTPVWYDRYYNPGYIDYDAVLNGGFTPLNGAYVNSPTLFYDVPTTLTLEPGVLYQYFHNGEQSALSAVQTFAGTNKDRLRLNIDNWARTTVDSSIYNNTVTIDNPQLSWFVTGYKEPGYTDRDVLNFDNTDFIKVGVAYNDSYNLKNEFTLSFWLYNNDWSNATSTQLVGNLFRGGYGVFYNNLNYNPFYVIPENTYGHLIYFNQDNNNYNEQNIGLIQNPPTPTNPSVVSINSNSEIIIVDTDNKQLTKYDYLGNTLTYSKDLSGKTITIPSINNNTQLVIDGDNNVIIMTSDGAYLFDQNLKQTDLYSSAYASLSSISSLDNSQLVFDINGNIQYVQNCLAAIYDSNNNLWTVSNTDNNLYLNGVLYYNLNSTTKAANLIIDPSNKLWILNDTPTVTTIDLNNTSNVNTFNIGILPSDSKNIGFIKTYNRGTNSYTWYALIYFSSEGVLYRTNLNGDIIKTRSLITTLNLLDPITASQNNTLPNLTFNGNGDFTGYEWKRIFNKVKYNQNDQIQFKVSTKTSPNLLPQYYTYTLSVPVQYLVNNAWHLITATYKNNTLSLYIDNYLRDTLLLPGNTTLSYDLKNTLCIGTPTGKSDNLNNEISTTSIIWNGAIDTVRIYDYAIDPTFIKYFVREKTIANDIVWNIPTTSLQYIESIDKFFKHRVPGSKSTFFNIRISGTQITDPALRLQIENEIIQTIQKIKPAYTELLNVEWIN